MIAESVGHPLSYSTGSPLTQEIDGEPEQPFDGRLYLQPDGESLYLQPDGESLYLQP